MNLRKPNSWKVFRAATSAAILLPFALYLVGFYDPPDMEGYVCGLYILGPLFLTFFLIGALGLVGLAAGIKSYRSRPGPRKLRHKIELLLHAIPLALVGIAIAIIFVG